MFWQMFRNPAGLPARVKQNARPGAFLGMGLVIGLVLGACRVSFNAAQATAAPTVATPPPANTVLAPVAAQDLPKPSLFAEGWTDETPFKADINPADLTSLQRLADAAVYHMDLTLDDSLTQMAGRMEVRYVNHRPHPLDEVYFRLFPNLFGGKLTVGAVKVNGEAADATLEEQDSALRVRLPASLAAGQAVIVALDWDLEIPQEGNSNYNTFAFADGVLALAQFYPLIPATDADGWYVRVPPQFGDVPFVEASFYRVRVTAPAGFRLAGSGRVSEDRATGGRQVWEFNAGPARDFYLAGAAQLDCREKVENGLTLRVCGVNLDGESMRTMLQLMSEAVTAMGAAYQPYPYAELEVIATPTSALGVEYPGVIAMNQRLFDPAAQMGQVSGRVMRETTLVHEIAHQWFYNLVGNDQVDEPWLDEALAQYATYQFYRDQYGAGAGEGLRQSFEDRWGRVERAETPIGLAVDAYADSEYGAIVYGRGPLFLIAVEEEIGRPAFAAFLKQYSTEYAWRIASTETFQSLLEQTCGCDLDSMFAEWVLEP